MATLLIGYNMRINPPEKDFEHHDAFVREIKRMSSAYDHAFDSVWLISTRKTPAQARDLLTLHIDDGDKLLVLDVTRDLGAWAGFGGRGLWLQNKFRLDHQAAPKSASGGRGEATSGIWNPVNFESASALITGLQPGHFGSVIVYGHENGSPFAAIIDPEGHCQRLEVPGSGPVSSAAVSDEIELVVDGDPPLHLLGDGVEGFRSSAVVPIEDAVRLWTVCGDENPQVVVLDRSGRLLVADPVMGLGAVGEGLWLEHDDLSSAPLVVSQGEVNAYVAGRLRGGSADPGEQVWMNDFHSGWQRVTVEPVPDGFTDMVSGAIFAGHRQGLPVLYDEAGGAINVPAVPLDSEHPHVCIAGVRGDRVVLALQSAETGPQLWAGTGEHWSVELLPPGRLIDACITGRDHAWVLFEGRSLWHCAQPWPGP